MPRKWDMYIYDNHLTTSMYPNIKFPKILNYDSIN